MNNDTKKLIVENDPDKITITWCTEDVIDQAANHDIELSIEEGREILNTMDCNHDCNYGISWETIDVYIDDLVSRREKIDPLNQAIIDREAV